MPLSAEAERKYATERCSTACGCGPTEEDHVRDASQRTDAHGALPREAWTGLGVLELICTVGLIVPAALHWKPALTVAAATILALESLVFVWVHLQYREIGPIIFSAMLGVLMAFIAYGRMVMKPIG